MHIVSTSCENIRLLALGMAMKNITAPLRDNAHWNLWSLPHLWELGLARPISTDENFEVSLLIGKDHFWDQVEVQVIRGDGPTTVASKPGYLLSGPMKTPPDQISATAVTLLNTILSTRKEELNLERFWSLEAIGISPQSERNDQELFLQHYCKSSITGNEDGTTVQSSPGKIIHLLFQQTMLNENDVHGLTVLTSWTRMGNYNSKREGRWCSTCTLYPPPTSQERITHHFNSCSTAVSIHQQLPSVWMIASWLDLHYLMTCAEILARQQ